MYKRPFRITKLEKGKFKDIEDTIVVERPIVIEVQNSPIVTIIGLPKDLKELAIGFIYTSGIIDSIEEIIKIEENMMEYKVSIIIEEKCKERLNGFDTDSYNRIIKTSCGIPSFWRDLIAESIDLSKEKLDDIKIHSKIIFQSIVKMQSETILFRETGGCHGAALFDYQGNLLSIMEDVGRHNAIDKVIGSALIKEIDLKKTFLCSTGRLTGDSVLKAARSRIPILASLSAAVESGVRVAFSYDLTLLGFVRGGKMNIYSRPDRILV